MFYPLIPLIRSLIHICFVRRCAVAYFIIMAYIVLHMLNETRPMWYYVLAACLFILSQLAWFLLGKVICKVRYRPSISYILFYIS